MLIVLGLGAGLCAQDVEIPPSTTTPSITPQQQEELDNAKTIIKAEGNTAETRLITAVRLLRMETPARIDLAVQLLSDTHDPGAPMAVCEAIRQIGSRQPELLDERLVDPLIGLLGHGNEQLSTGAAAALSVFRDGDVARRLGALASDSRQPEARRVAAIGALARNTDQRVTVSELVQLLFLPDAGIVRRSLDALRPASRVDFGSDAQAWQAWWQDKLALDDAEWLRDRLDLAVERNSMLRAENARLRRQAESQEELSIRRFDELLRRVYQLTTQQEQREALVQEWLADAMVSYRLCALGLVRERINDGIRPADGIRAGVEQCLTNASPQVRVSAVEVIGLLTDPADAAILLRLLPNEANQKVREAILRALGRLGNPAAIDVLIAELKRTESDPGCLREAARSLGALGGRGRGVAPDVIAPAVQPLLDRFSSTVVTDLPRREALLEAMAEIGDPAFGPVFVASLSATKVELLLPAITGTEVIRDTAQLDRLLTLMTHNDPRVRQLAVHAVGTLGSEPAHLEALVSRMNPNSEANAGVQGAAWEAFRAVLSRNPPNVRIQWIDERLSGLPDRQIKLLEEFITRWSASNSAPAELLLARACVCKILIGQSRFVEAIPHLRQYRAMLSPDDSRYRQLTLDLARAIMRSDRRDRIAEVVEEVGIAPDASLKSEIVDVIFEVLSTLRAQGEQDTVATLINDLRNVSQPTLAPELSRRLDAFNQPANDTTPNGDASTDPDPDEGP